MKSLALSSVLTVLAIFGPLDASGAASLPSAFTVGQNSHLHLTNATTIPFNTVITWKHPNSRSGGVFTCQRRGLYKFQVYALTRSDKPLWLELCHNDKVIVSVWAHTPTDYGDAGNAAILDLAVGDRVYVRSRDQYDVNLYGEPDQIYTTFTGVFIGHMLSDALQGSQSAFSVALDHPLNITGQSSPVIYNKVILDVAYAYDVNSGIYTAPSDGIYIFHFFSNGERGSEMWQDLYHDNNYVCSIYNYQLQDDSAAGNTVILHLATNDQVKVLSRSSVDNILLGAADTIYTTFSGVQISKTSDNNGNGTLVAFSVGLEHITAFHAGDVVKFDRVFLNLKKGYDLTTGMFTAPTAGFYEFNYHALGETSETIWLELFHNYKYINSLYSHEPSQYSAGGNAAVLQLDSGDVVHVNVRHGDSTETLYGDYNQIYCTFSGYLLATTSSSLDIVGK